MKHAADHMGLPIAQGSYEQAKAMIGVRGDIHFAEVAINWPMIKSYRALTEDGNPSYWDEDFARSAWGAIISPPGTCHGHHLQEDHHECSHHLWLLPGPLPDARHHDSRSMLAMT